MVLSLRRAFVVHLGSAILPIELISAVARGNAFLATIFGCLTVFVWIELAAFYGLNVEKRRWLEYGSIVGFVGLYLFYVIFRWREFLLDGF